MISRSRNGSLLINKQLFRLKELDIYEPIISLIMSKIDTIINDKYGK